MKNVRSSQPCVSMNFCTESSSSMWVSFTLNDIIGEMRMWHLIRTVFSGNFSNETILTKKHMFLVRERFFAENNFTGQNTENRNKLKNC